MAVRVVTTPWVLRIILLVIVVIVVIGRERRRRIMIRMSRTLMATAIGRIPTVGTTSTAIMSVVRWRTRQRVIATSTLSCSRKLVVVVVVIICIIICIIIVVVVVAICGGRSRLGEIGKIVEKVHVGVVCEGHCPGCCQGNG